MRICLVDGASGWVFEVILSKESHFYDVVTVFMIAINKAANIAVLTFKLLIVIACLSILVVSVDRVLSTNSGVLGFTHWLYVCNALVFSAYMITGVMFVLWFFPAYKAAYVRWPDDLYYTPKWTILGFSLLLLNLFMPYLLVAKMWRQLKIFSENNGLSPDGGIHSLPVYINMWWLSHLIYFVGEPSLYLIWSNSDDIGQIDNLLAISSIISYFVVCNSARLALRLVNELNTRLTQVLNNW